MERKQPKQITFFITSAMSYLYSRVTSESRIVSTACGVVQSSFRFLILNVLFLLKRSFLFKESNGFVQTKTCTLPQSYERLKDYRTLVFRHPFSLSTFAQQYAYPYRKSSMVAVCFHQGNLSLDDSPGTTKQNKLYSRFREII